MSTVASIAKEAFDAVAAEFTDTTIKACSLTRVTDPGTYNPGTGEYEGRVETTATGRALFDTSTPVEDVFPAYVAGPSDRLVWLEGLSLIPAENETIAIGGQNHTVKAVGDVVGAGTFFSAMVVKS